jgi:hypothetical protein
MILPSHDAEHILVKLGFRCIHPTEFCLKDGSLVWIQAIGWPLENKELPPSESHAATLRMYAVRYQSGKVEELDEVDVQSLVGTETWQNAS